MMTTMKRYLDDDDEADSGADVGRCAVHAGHDVNNRLTHRYHHAKHCGTKTAQYLHHKHNQKLCKEAKGGGE